MSEFGFDPADLFRRAGQPPRRPRVVRSRPPFSGWRRWVAIAVTVVVVVALVLGSLVGLRVQQLFLDSTGHSNVFWTPLVTKVILFVIGFVAVGGLVALNILPLRRVAGTLDRRGPLVATLLGAVVALLAGVIGGGFLAGQWQEVLLWLHAHSFNQPDPVFHQDASFFLFSLPVYDDLQGMAWGVAIVSLLLALAAGAACLAVETAPTDVPLPLTPPPGTSPREGIRYAAVHLGIALVAIFVLASLGSHFGVYHLATSVHTNPDFVGLDATERNVTKPVLGFLQYVALVLAIATAVVVWTRRRQSGLTTAIVLGSMLGGWLVFAGLVQGVPAAIYQGASVNPNAQTAQHDPIADFLNTSRQAWALQGTDVQTRQFADNPVAPQVQDLAGDPATLRNTRIQDFRELPDTFAQLDRTKPFQTFPSITVDRYRASDGSETEVMLAPREIAESDVPNPSFVSRSLLYTHGYGITAASVNQVTSDGNPYLIAGRQPLQLTATGGPANLQIPDLAVADPRIYCGLATTQPVVVNSTQQEFDYPSGQGDKFVSYGDKPGGMSVPGGLDRLAVSLNQFSGLDLLLTSSTTSNSRLLLHRQVVDRINTIAPFLRVDGDPYVVADPQSGHLVWIVDAYVASDRYPEAFRQDDGTSYQRNTVKVTIDARTCETTLYVLDPNEPLTATYSDIYPNLFTPFDRMPMSLRQHLRYPEDLFQNQARAYAAVHVTDPNVLYNRSDVWRLAQENIGDQTQDTQAYYVELTLPGESAPQFVLLQTFSPVASSGGGGSSNVMVAWLAAQCDYTSSATPKLVAVPLNRGANVLGPLQFDNNINTDPKISSQLTLLRTGGSTVTLGNVIVLPFANKSFLYVRPLYVKAAGGSFPQMRFVIVGTRDGVAYAATLPDALATLYGQPIPGLAAVAPSQPSQTPAPSPGASPSPSPSGSPGPLPPQVLALVQDLIAHEQRAQAAFQAGDFATYGQEQAAIKRDVDQLRALLGPAAAVLPTPSPSPTH